MIFIILKQKVNVGGRKKNKSECRAINSCSPKIYTRVDDADEKKNKIISRCLSFVRAGLVGVMWMLAASFCVHSEEFNCVS